MKYRHQWQAHIARRVMQFVSRNEHVPVDIYVDLATNEYAARSTGTRSETRHVPDNFTHVGRYTHPINGAQLIDDIEAARAELPA